MKSIIKSILGRFTKVQLGIIVALLAITFLFNENNVHTRYKYNMEITDLNNQIDYYQKQKEENSRKLNELKSNKENVEKFARENYLMKKDNEDIFIVEDKKEE